jgi:1,4-alpha-glucan branching enzyme
MIKSKPKTKTPLTKTKEITFELLAPRNEAVSLLGSWNDWHPTNMKRGNDSNWRVDVALADGEYEYKFEVVSHNKDEIGETILVCDPRTIEFSAEDDSGTKAKLRVKDGKRVITSYQWEHDDVPLPSNEQLIIYEMHLGDFRGGPGDDSDEEGTFKRIIEKLDYLRELGVNAIQMMPVNETAADNYWGYSQRSIYAVENTYGTPDELCQLVDECHARGIRVIHDAVFNHVDERAGLAKIDYGYWFYEVNPDKPELQFGPKFNYEYYDEERNVFPAREYVLGAMNLWISEFHMDGIRFDSTRALKYFDLLRWFDQEAHNRAGFKPFYTIAEHLPQDPKITKPEGPIDSAWHDDFYRQMTSTILMVGDDQHQPFNIDEVLRVLNAHSAGFASNQAAVNFLNNHDQERLMYVLGSKAKLYDEAAFRRNKLGATLLLTSGGLPMLWMGEEFGQATQKSEKRQPLHWSLLKNGRNQDLWQHYQCLIELRKTNPALYSDNFEVIACMPEQGVIAFKRWNDKGNLVVVVANLMPHSVGEVQIPIAGIEDGQWHEAIYDYDVVVQQNTLIDTLAETEAKIYIKH